MPTVTGATRLYGIVGDPIAEVRSPSTFNPLIEAAGVNAVLVPLQVRAAEFAETMDGLMRLGNLDGLFVTFPHKQAALHLAARVSERARRVGAVNAMRRDADGLWTADIFDGVGFVRAVRTAGRRVEGADIALVGAGGAGRAIAFELAAEGAARLSIDDLDSARAEGLIADLAAAHPNCAVRRGRPEPARHDILINATPVGFAGEAELPFGLDRLRPESLVVDIVPRPGSRLLATAEALGAATIRGTAMVEGQAKALLGFFGIGEARKDQR
jgi:shikimate dehydrogenase